MNSLIQSNYFLTPLSNSSIKLYSLIFESEEILNDLRKSNPSNTYLRFNEVILFWGDDIHNSAEKVELNPKENFYKVSKILAEILLKQFRVNLDKYSVHKRFHIYKLTFLDKDEADGLFEGMNLFKTFRFHFSPLYINGVYNFGFSISRSSSPNVYWKEEDFINNDIDCSNIKFDDETEEAFSNTTVMYRIANKFNKESDLKHKIDTLNSANNEINNINQFVQEYFIDNLGLIKSPEGFKIKSIIKLESGFTESNLSFESSIIKKPELYFYLGKYPKFENKYSIRKKINYNKPFTYSDFENSSINISLIYQKKHYSTVRTFFKDVQDELVDTFRLSKESFKYTTYEIDEIELVDYQKQFAHIKDTNLLIVVVDQKHEQLPPSKSPYFFCKSEFIKRGINTQEVQIQQIENYQSDKQHRQTNYTHHNIALNIYAKLGGLGWTIKPNDKSNELVIGIGATTDKENQPVLGLATIFRGDGKYLFGKATSVTGMRNYQQRLEKLIFESIINNIEKGSIDSQKEIQLIFHIFKPAGKDNEIKALNNVLSRLSRYKIKYAFIHIGYGHNYRFFKLKQNINTRKDTTNLKVNNERGLYLKINNRLGFLGLQPLSSNFIKLEIHPGSNFFDLDYIANQVYQFADMSHTSYNKGSKPVTIKYPNLMAYFAEKFKEGELMYYDDFEISIPDNSLWFI